MTRTIKASEVKPGMTIRWTHNKVTYECPVMDRDGTDEDGGVLCHVTEEHSQYVNAGAGEVTVLSEPQPEEPTAFGAYVHVGESEAVRVSVASSTQPLWATPKLMGPKFQSWEDLQKLGPITIPGEQDAAATAPAPVVPDRIEEWPENDEHLRAYEWRDCDGRPWVYSRTHGRWYNFSLTAISKLVTDAPVFGPWTRVADA